MGLPRILVVEDEQIVAASLRKRLESLGYEVPALASGGLEAIQQAEALRPDLVLMDIRLDGEEMDGVEAAAIIRQRFRIPVVYLTAYSNREILERVKCTEPYGYILKPYEERELHVVLEMALYKHRMEQQYHSRERWLSAVVNSIGDGVVTTDAEGRITFLNPVAEKLTGWTTDAARNRPLEDIVNLVDEEDGHPVPSPLRTAIEQHRNVPLGAHILLLSKDSVKLPINDCASPITDTDGTLLGGVMVFRDITHSQRLEEQLRQAQKLEAVGRLAGGVAHDFNNLLTVINGYCGILMSGMNGPDTSRMMLEQIHKAGDRAAALTQQLLAYSRKQILQPREFCLNELLAGMRQFLNPLIREDIALVTTLDSQPCRVKADPHQIEHVIMNLAVNARDAMPLGGRLAIATQHVELGESFQNEFPEVRLGPYVQLTVTDTGVGMNQETLEHAFEPFFTTKEPGQGTGLGLAMVYGIVKQSGGHIQVTSQPGQGTCFQIFLPRLRAEPVQTTPLVGTPGLASGSESILLVEDETAVRIFLEVVLQEAGYHVLVAANGEQALELSARQATPIDLLVTDVVMPGLSGGQVAEALRASRPDIRVLFLSGHTEDALVHHGVRNAKAAFLQKPFTAEAITRKIRNVLDGTRV